MPVVFRAAKQTLAAGRRKDIPLLTSLRFFAALAVIILHYDSTKRLFPLWASSYGYEAVTFFFILSGFILTYVHCVHNSRNTYLLNVSDKRFLLSRACRILPSYIVALIVSFPFFLYSYFISDLIELRVFAMALVLVPLLAQAWVPPVATAWNVPAWSLSVEGFFYLIFPATLRALGRQPAHWVLTFASAGVVATQLLSQGLTDRAAQLSISESTWHNFISYFPMFHLSQFFFGVALGLVFVSRKLESTKSDAILAMAFGIQFLDIYFKTKFEWLGSSVVLCACFGCLIVASAAATGPLARLFSCRPLVFLGEASYSMYIFHSPVRAWWIWLSTKKLGVALTQTVDFGIYFSLVLIVSSIAYVSIERPAKAWLSRQQANSRAHLAGDQGREVG